MQDASDRTRSARPFAGAGTRCRNGMIAANAPFHQNAEWEKERFIWSTFRARDAVPCGGAAEPSFSSRVSLTGLKHGSVSGLGRYWRFHQ